MYGNATACVCPLGSYLNGTTKPATCTACAVGCASCNATTCFTCSAGYQKVDGVCVTGGPPATNDCDRMIKNCATCRYQARAPPPPPTHSNWRAGQRGPGHGVAVLVGLSWWST